jgi:hypothetical protein
MLPGEILDDLISENNPVTLQSEERLRQMIAAINYFISNDFGKLVQVLYRVDVSESLLKKMLQEQPTADAATLIANLLVERQVQKLLHKQEWKAWDSNISEEEKW